MTPRSRALSAAVLTCMVAVGGCRSDADSTPAGTTESAAGAATGDSSTAGAGSETEAPSTPDSDVPTPDSDVPAEDDSPPADDSPPDGAPVQSEPGASTDVDVPADADEIVLSDSSSGDGDTWDEGEWEVDTPGEASARVIGGVGVMETDERGTHEWVRALAENSIHDDATLYATITPIRSDEGTVFVGLRGDGEWRDATPYLPQVGAVVEYSYAAVFEGEIVLTVLDGPDERRVGPVSGPILDDGDSANIRFDVVGDRARVKIWRTGDDEPSGWDLEAEAASTDGGVVQIAYRDGVGQSVAWNELRLEVWP